MLMLTWTETTLDLDLGMWLTYACWGVSLSAPQGRELVAAALADDSVPESAYEACEVCS